jgi:CoA:oxalate CoA-transferase
MRGLLSDVRILDLTRMLAGPYGSMLLGDMGAEVIKVEDPGGDYTRLANSYFLSINRNKKTIVLDLKNPRGLELFYELAKVSDVVIDNMRPKALRKLKCEYDDLKKVNPQIISCSLSGYGHTGPYQDRPAFDLTIQALSGAMSLTGEKDGPPVRMGLPVADVAGGMFAALGIVSALHYRDKTGIGQKLDISLLDGQISMATYLAAFYLIDGVVPGPQGTRHETIVPYEAFQTRDIWIVVTCVTPKFWEGFCRALELKELITDERFKDGAHRLANYDELIPIIQKTFLEKTGDEWIRLLEKEEVPCAPVNTLDRTLNDPQVLSRNMVIEMQHSRLGRLRLAGNPIKASEAEESFTPPPELGEHTEMILGEILGYSRDRIEKLKEEKVIGAG